MMANECSIRIHSLPLIGRHDRSATPLCTWIPRVPSCAKLRLVYLAATWTVGVYSSQSWCFLASPNSHRRFSIYSAASASTPPRCGSTYVIIAAVRLLSAFGVSSATWAAWERRVVDQVAWNGWDVAQNGRHGIMSGGIRGR